MTKLDVDQRRSEIVRSYFTNPSQALELAQQLLQETIKTGKPELQIQAYFSCAEAYDFLGRHDEMTDCMNKAQQHFDDLESEEERAYFLSMLGTYYAAKGDFAKGYAPLYQALAIQECLEPEGTRLAQTIASLGFLHESASEYEEALEYYLRSLRLYESYGSEASLSQAYTGVGNVYIELRMPEKASAYYNKGLTSCNAIGNKLSAAFILDKMGFVCLEQKKAPKALEYFEAALEGWRELSSELNFAATLANSAHAHIQLGNSIEAMKRSHEALKIAEGQQDEILCMMTSLDLGMQYHQREDFEQAVRYTRQSLRLAQKRNMRSTIADAHKQLAEVYENSADLNNALEHFKQYTALREEILSTKKQESIANLELRHKLAQAERDRQILALESEKAAREVAGKTKELSAMAISITQRNAALMTLRNLARPFAESARGKTKQLAGAILDNIDNTVNNYAAKQIFEEQFEGVFQDFVQKLKTRAPKLTPAEIKICVMIRLDLSTKQIAEALFIALETAKLHRKHIRKKLGLSPDQNLSSFLLGL